MLDETIREESQAVEDFTRAISLDQQTVEEQGEEQNAATRTGVKK